jgi:hypothetical protein
MLITIAIIVGVVVANVVMFTAMLSKPVMKWYTNKVLKMTFESMEESAKVFEEKELL